MRSKLMMAIPVWPHARKSLAAALLVSCTGLAGLAGTAGLVSAQELKSANPNDFVKSAVETVVKAAKSDPAAKDGDIVAMTRVVHREFLPYTDFERTTQMATGASWDAATPDQRKQLVAQFTELLMHTYALQLTQIRDTKVQFKFDAAKIDAKGDDGVVQTEVKGIGTGDALQVGYRIARTQGVWHIYDIDMMGVWLSTIYKGQFSGQLAKNGVDGLIKYLSDHNARFAK
jgi:phospholipid transport system substrate-binding protein